MSSSASPSISPSTSSISPIDGIPAPFLPLHLHGRNPGGQITGQNTSQSIPGQQSEDPGARHLDMDNDGGIDDDKEKRKESGPDSESEKKESGRGSESEKSHGHSDDHGGEDRDHNQDQGGIITGDKDDLEKKDSDIDKNICEGDKTTATATAMATAMDVEHLASRDDDDDDGDDDGGVANQDSGVAKEEKCKNNSSEGKQGKDQRDATEEEMTSPVKEKDHASVSDAKSHGGVNMAEEPAVTDRVDESESEGSHANDHHEKEARVEAVSAGKDAKEARVEAVNAGKDAKEARVEAVSAGKDAHAVVSASVSSDLQETQDHKHVSESESEAAKKPGDDVNKDIGDHSGTSKDSDLGQDVAAHTPQKRPGKDSDLGQDVAAHTPQKRPRAAMHAADVITGTA